MTTSTRIRLAGLLALFVVPWTVVPAPGGIDLVLPWGLVDPATFRVVDLYTYLFVYTGGPATLPDRLLAWPIATGLYLLSVGSVALGRLDREDPRVSAGLLFAAGVAHLQVTFGLRRIGVDAVPVGAVLSFPVAWWILSARDPGRSPG